MANKPLPSFVGEETPSQVKLRQVLKRRREEFEEETQEDEGDGLQRFFYHIYDNIEKVCVQNAILIDYLKDQVQKQKSAQVVAIQRKSFLAQRKTKQVNELVDDGSKIVFASRTVPLDELKYVFGENIEVIDVSTRGKYRQLHPAFPLMSIPIPNCESKAKASSVLGLFEGLKVFEHQKFSISLLRSDKLNGLYRSETAATGRLLGYSYGISEDSPILPETEARYKIYITSYKLTFERPEGAAIIKELKEKLKAGTRLVLVDTDTPNPDWNDTSTKISHCPLIRAYIEGKWPSWEEYLTHVNQEDNMEEEEEEGEGDEEEDDEDEIVIDTDSNEDDESGESGDDDDSD